jgi:beta-mannosidase
LRLSRAVSGEVMAAVFSDWRRARSACRGALVWFLGDLWPGAGWGVIDSTGLPKAPYYYLKRVLQPLALFITDEGTNGLMIHIANDGPALHARLEVRQFKFSQAVGTPACKVLDIAAAGALELPATDLYEGFVDLSYAYRFGQAACDVLHAALLRESDGAVLAQAFYFPQGLPSNLSGEIGLAADATPLDEETLRLDIRCRGFAQSVHVEMPGFIADDQYFHMAPNSRRTLTVKRRPAARVFEGTVHALNSTASCRIARSS